MMPRQVIAEFTLEPGTGKAIELLMAQILRIEQVEGGQCADFNAFNLHDYKEFMHCGRTRTVHGFHPTKGTFMWSAPRHKPTSCIIRSLRRPTSAVEPASRPSGLGLLFPLR